MPSADQTGRTGQPSGSPTPDVPQEMSSQTQRLKLASRPDLPTLWFDHLKVSVRKDRTSDRELVALIGFYHQVPEENGLHGTEIARVACSPELARKLADTVCRTLNYYPVRNIEQAKTT